MRKRTMQWLTTASLTVVVSLSAGNAESASIVSLGGLGNLNWADTNAWAELGSSTHYIPGATDSADNAFVRNGSVLTVNSAVPAFANLTIGESGTSSGAINVAGGGVLAPTGSFQVGRTGTGGGYGYLNITGGSVTAGTVTVGSGSRTGTVTITSGTLRANLVIGAASDDSGDKVIVTGSAASISGTNLTANAGSTVKFVFDANGISPMTYAGTATFSPGSAIVVDGAAYTGGTNTFELITAGTLNGENSTVILTNFNIEVSSAWDTLNNIFRVMTGVQDVSANSIVLDTNSSVWSNPAAWTGNILPGAADTAYIRNNYTVTVNSAVPSVTGIIIGNAADTGTVNVVTGGTLTATGNVQLGRSLNNGAKGILNLSGGTVQVANPGRMIIGLDGTNTHSTGLLNISGGTFDGRLLVGSDVVGNSGDTVRINGSKATVRSALITGNPLEVRGSGTLEFIFDAAGISTMTYAGTAAFSRGSSIVVDGAAYTGGAGTFDLISAGTLQGAQDVAISLINFTAGTSCKWTNGVLRLTVAGAAPAFPAFIRESARNVPVAASVDVVVVGGSGGAVAAAVAAAQGGASVYLLAPRTYLGEDLCGTFRLYLQNGEVPQSALAKTVFTGPAADSNPLTVTPVESAGGFTRAVPLYVKQALDNALISNNVQFIYGVYPSDVLRDSGGRIAGVVIANRSGRQAIRAHTVIDATPRAVVARLAGAAFTDYPSGTQTFSRVVVGSNAKAAGGVIAGSREILPAYDPTFRHSKASAELNELGMKYPLIEYTLNLPMADGSFRSFSQAEQIARDFTCAYSDENEADYLFQVPPDQMTGAASATGSWPGAGQISLDAFRPVGKDGLYVLGGCADISRQQAAELLRPLNLMDVGARIGSAAAAAGSVDPAKPVTVASAVAASDGSELGDIRETLKGLRSTSSGLPIVRQPQRGLPVLGKYDVVVVGGGTSGAPAGIAAARQGRRTLVLEYQNALGGVGTMGMIFSYHGSSGTGFAVEITEASGKLPDEPPGTPVARWKGNARMEWLRRQIRVAGGDVWFSVIGCGALVQNGRVIGVVVATPEGRGVVLADAVIDATGNSDIAVAAGAAYQYIDSREFAMQDAGISFREMPWRLINSGYTITDEADAVDVWHMYVYSRRIIKNVFDLGTFINTRERQRIVGDYTLDVTDVMAQQTFPDTVSQYRANLDTHGYLIHPFFNLAEMPESGTGFDGNVPYRCLLPQGLEGILSVGLGISAHRDAMPFVRMQPSLINIGYAAGVAASMAVSNQTGLREINIRELQQHLVDIGNLTPEVLTDGNSFPVSDQALAAAIGSFTNDLKSCAIVLSAGSRAIAPLKAAFNQSSGRKKERCAVALAMLGDTSGVDTLIARLNSSTEWDLGWGYRKRETDEGETQSGSFVSELDGIIRALGMAGDRRAIPAIIRLALMLDANGAYSHYHSVAYALSLMPSLEGADALYSLLGMTGMTGWVTESLERDKALQGSPDLPSEVVLREASPREVMLAASLYRNGDKNGRGQQILENYSQDLRGAYGRFVSQVLVNKGGFFFIMTGK